MNLQAFNFGFQSNLALIIGNIIRAALSLTGTIFLVLIIYAGFIWMTAGGNEEKIRKAKLVIQSAVIGLIIILSSYSITNFVVGSLSRAVNGN